MKFNTLAYESGELMLLDQRELPNHMSYMSCHTLQDVIVAIRDMVVRGAPAIGVTAAYGMVLGAKEMKELTPATMLSVKEQLDRSRPTAVNLMWATERIFQRYSSCYEEALLEGTQLDKQASIAVLLEEAKRMHEEDTESCRLLSAYGNSLVSDGDTILTHCNAGALATTAYGTAVGVITAAYDAGKNIRVYADETRPRLQGARLTSWELFHHGVDVTLIADSVAATLIRDRVIDMVVVGADRIAANGDTANKIGTFMLAALCKQYQIPFYIAAPKSTVDFSLSSGKEIVIEERSGEEIRVVDGQRIALKEIPVYNPAFDVTPADHITAIITDEGIKVPPYETSLQTLLNKEERNE